MSYLDNMVQLEGYLGKDPELKIVTGDRKFLNISIAVSDAYYNAKTGEKSEETDWHKLNMWNNTAEFVSKNARKGSKIRILGKLKNSSYEAQDGKKVKYTFILVNEIEILSGWKDKQVKAEEKTKTDNQFDSFESEDDDLPF